MKRFLLILLTLLLICAFSACDGDTKESDGAASTEDISGSETESLTETSSGEKRLKMQSGSMEPAIKNGAWVRYLPVEDPTTLQVGDILVSRDPTLDNAMIVHRIVEIQTAEDGSLRFVTKGDGNAVVDREPVLVSQIVGRVTSHS